MKGLTNASALQLLEKLSQHELLSRAEQELLQQALGAIWAAMASLRERKNN